MAEALSFEYYRQNGVQIRVARIFNTYGPRMLENDGRVVSNFIVQVGAASLFFPPKPTILCNELTSPPLSRPSAESPSLSTAMALKRGRFAMYRIWWKV